ncbi:hypothetical protein OKW43_008020 [Paraburkholderia sp. WC7.3g]|uniref:hypothetical protein n=1 Tax=Paraburkholderia sp. WC7.3g TaxID=2991070 RepID=UPI003D190077
MLSNQQAADLLFLHQGEVEGEAFFNTMLAQAEDLDERYKLAIILQVENETKARLRSCLTAHQIYLPDPSEAILEGRRKAAHLKTQPWSEFISCFRSDVLYYRDIYHEIAHRGALTAMCALAAAVAHEDALLSFCTMELAGLGHKSVEQLLTYLRFAPTRR